MRKAQEHLNLIDQDVISFHATEMVARMVLNMADDIVLQFQEEGILSEKDSEEFFKKTNHDMKRIDQTHHRSEYLASLAYCDLAAKDDAETHREALEHEHNLELEEECGGVGGGGTKAG